MTAITLHHALNPAAPLAGDRKGTDAAGTAGTKGKQAEAVPMDADVAKTLSDAAVNAQRVGYQGNQGGEGAAPPVELRQSDIPFEDARTNLAGITPRIRETLSALVGARDPIKTEEGAAIKASEGAAGQSAVRTIAEAPPSVEQQETRKAAFSGFLESSPFTRLAALLRKILLDSKANDLKSSADMTTMQREVTIVATDKGIEKARSDFGGAMGSMALTGAIGGAALKQTVTSTDMQTKSLQRNMNNANKASISAENGRAGIKASGTPSDQLKPAQNIDSGPVSKAEGGSRPAADLQGDMEADRATMEAVGKHNSQHAAADPLQNGHSLRMAQAQVPASNAIMLNMLGPSVGNSLQAGVGINGAMLDAERQVKMNDAETSRRIADAHHEQSIRHSESFDAAAQSLEQFMNRVESTGNHIIQNM